LSPIRQTVMLCKWQLAGMDEEMKLMAKLSVLIVAALHVGFLALEMFLWQEPVGMQVFQLTVEEAANTAVLAANQGLYNGFLAAGLIWGVMRNSREFVLFFLAGVIAAGVYGSITASASILYVQALPASVAFLLNIRRSS
jgi:putative membrane protein